jgi:hypothetical protein
MDEDFKKTYKPIEIEIADYIFSHPDKIREDILSHFVAKCRKNRRTIERYYKKAQEYNQTRILSDEKVKDEVRHEQIKEAVKTAILSRNESLEILSRIASGQARKIGDDILAPSDGDRIRAIQQLSKMQMWDKPDDDKMPAIFTEQLVFTDDGDNESTTENSEE